MCCFEACRDSECCKVEIQFLNAVNFRSCCSVRLEGRLTVQGGFDCASVKLDVDIVATPSIKDGLGSWRISRNRGSMKALLEGGLYGCFPSVHWGIVSCCLI